MAASRSKSMTISLPAELHEALVAASTTAGLSPESLAADAIRDRLETALRYRVLVERLGIVDQALLDIAAVVGETAAAADALTEGKGEFDKICRYHSPG